MTSKPLRRYTLENINDIIYKGFDYKLPDETLKTISELALQVGSPDYVKTPVFAKNENSEAQIETLPLRKRRGHKNMDVINEDWETIKSFQTTKIEDKVGIDADIDCIRGFINKLSDKNYSDMRNNIFAIIEKMITENISQENMTRVSMTLFDMASNNRFYSKIYADLYTELSSKYPIVDETFHANLESFTDLFNTIEYVDPNVNYDRFCEINKINEKRKSLATFYMNLTINGKIGRSKLVFITRNLVEQIYNFISLENKKNEVDELTENVAILYKKSIYENSECCEHELIDGLTISEVIRKIATSKVKDYKSLTNKSLFKFMDLIDM